MSIPREPRQEAGTHLPQAVTRYVPAPRPGGGKQGAGHRQALWYRLNLRHRWRLWTVRDLSAPYGAPRECPQQTACGTGRRRERELGKGAPGRKRDSGPVRQAVAPSPGPGARAGTATRMGCPTPRSGRATARSSVRLTQPRDRYWPVAADSATYVVDVGKADHVRLLASVRASGPILPDQLAEKALHLPPYPVHQHQG